MQDTDQLLQQLRQDGYVIFQLLSPEEAAHLNGLVRGLELQLFTRSPEQLQHRIAELIPKGDGSRGTGLGWHADYPYHDLDTPWPPPENPLGCQVLVCLDDFREDNGGTMFMPDSHKDKPEGLEDDEDGSFTGSVILTAPAGTVLVAHSAWMHRQTMNTSKNVRRALLGNYTPGHIVPKDNMEKQWHMLRESPEFGLLSTQQLEVLERLLLGTFKRGLYVGSPRP